MSDFEQRCAEALAEKFTRPMPRMVKGRPTDELADPLPGDRVEKTVSVVFTAGDGHPSLPLLVARLQAVIGPPPGEAAGEAP